MTSTPETDEQALEKFLKRRKEPELNKQLTSLYWKVAHSRKRRELLAAAKGVEDQPGNVRDLFEAARALSPLTSGDSFFDPLPDDDLIAKVRSTIRAPSMRNAIQHGWRVLMRYYYRTKGKDQRQAQVEAMRLISIAPLDAEMERNIHTKHRLNGGQRLLVMMIARRMIFGEDNPRQDASVKLAVKCFDQDGTRGINILCADFEHLQPAGGTTGKVDVIKLAGTGPPNKGRIDLYPDTYHDELMRVISLHPNWGPGQPLIPAWTKPATAIEAEPRPTSGKDARLDRLPYADLKLELEKLGREAGLPFDLGVRNWRRTVTSMRDQAGVPRDQLQRSLAHGPRGRSTETYLGFIDDEALDAMAGIRKRELHRGLVRCDCGHAQAIGHSRCLRCNEPLHQKVDVGSSAEAILTSFTKELLANTESVPA